MSESHLYVFIGELSVHIFCPFFDMFACFVCVEFEEFIIDPGYQPFVCTVTCKYLLPFCGLPLCFFDCFLCCAEAFDSDEVPKVYFCFCFLWTFFFLRFYLFIWQTEITSRQRSRQRERKGSRLSAQQMWSLIPGPWDHDLSWGFNPLSRAGTPRALILCWRKYKMTQTLWKT